MMNPIQQKQQQKKTVELFSFETYDQKRKQIRKTT